MSYSVPVRQRVSLAELKKHIYTLPDQPELIPYRTSYYAENWAFCMSHRQFESLQDEIYEVVIDSSLEPGSLTYGEFLHKGETEDEVLLSAHVCHPSLANDNCSGMALLTHLAKRLAEHPDAIQLPHSFCSRNDRGDYLAGPQRGQGERASNTAWSSQWSVMAVAPHTRKAGTEMPRSTGRLSTFCAIRD